MLRFASLGSGSSGNATLVEARSGAGSPTRVLIDCGGGWRALQAALAERGVAPDALAAVFITHEHRDHTANAQRLHAAGVPVYTSAGTGEALRAAGFAGDVRTVRDGQDVPIGALLLQPFTVPHDAREPLQLRCSDGARHLGVMTDCGHLTAHATRQLAGCHALMLEANHDPDMLAAGRYPAFLKRRIAGAHGHLSNAQAAAALAQLAHEALRTVIAAHLSEQNNLPELARTAFARALGCKEGDVIAATRHGAPAEWYGV